MWSWFTDLNAARASSGFAPLPISYQEIHDYSELVRAQVTPWEVSLLRRLDVAWLEVWEEKRPKTDNEKQAATKKVTVSSRPMSPALFDALFSNRANSDRRKKGRGR